MKIKRSDFFGDLAGFHETEMKIKEIKYYVDMLKFITRNSTKELKDSVAEIEYQLNQWTFENENNKRDTRRT